MLNNDLDQLDEHFKLNGSFNYEKMETLSKTHTLLSISVAESLKYMLFNIIPNNIFSIKEQTKLIKKESNGYCLINENLFNKKLEKLSIGSFVKFVTFSKSTFVLPGTGHSRLIIKIRDDKFIFIDPDDKKPKCDSFSAAKLTDKVSEIVSNIKSSSYAFIDNVKFMDRFQTKSLKNLHMKKMF
ncbi:MAG: hypothetical protein HYX60_04490 [Legionella longbeachae]|nr:hypothetical protein [Legionella longbeachae]